MEGEGRQNSYVDVYHFHSALSTLHSSLFTLHSPPHRHPRTASMIYIGDGELAVVEKRCSEGCIGVAFGKSRVKMLQRSSAA